MNIFLRILRKILRVLKACLFIFIETKWLKNDLDNQCREKSILLIRVDLIGDAVIWFDSAKEYKRKFLDSKITLICNESWAELAKLTGYFDEIITLNTNLFLNNFNYRYNFLRKLKGKNFDRVFNTSYSREFLLDDSIARVAPSGKKYAFQGDLFKTNKLQKYISNFWYNYVLESNNEIKHELERNADYIKEFVYTDFKASYPELEIISGIDEFKGSYFLVSPGASELKKALNIDKFSQIIAYILEKTEMKCILCGTQNEKKLCQKIVDEIQGENILDYSGKTNLTELLSLINNAEFVIGNDSAISHIAIALNKKNLCILNGVHYGRFFPYPDLKLDREIKVVSKNMKCFYCDGNFTDHCLQSIYEHGEFLCINLISIREIEIKLEGWL